MRSVSDVVTTPPPGPGFIGDGHTAVEVVTPDALAASDPFVLLMDDRLDLPRRRTIGGPHPHAGLETVTLVLEGTLHDRDEGALRAGDVLWMSVGRWLSARRRSHPALRERIAAVRAHVEEARRGRGLVRDVADDHARRRRRRLALAATAGAAVLTVAVLLLRRRPPAR